MRGSRAVRRDDIVKLLNEGHSNTEIARRLHTDKHRVATIRQELGIPRWEPTTALTLEQAWSARTEHIDGGHMRWTGYLREGTCPVFRHRDVDYAARRVSFLIANGREPEGRVLAGCGLRQCVAPAHMEDQPMRTRLSSQVEAIFGRAA